MNALWNRVQTLLAQRTKPFGTGTIGLFAGKARCLFCGYVLRSTKSRGRHYLQCPNRHIAKDACAGSFIAVDKLEQLVICELNRLLETYLDKAELIQHIEFDDDLQNRRSDLLSDIADLQNNLTKYSAAIRTLYMDRVTGLISENDYMEMSKAFSTDRSRLAHAITDKQNQLHEIEEKIASENGRGNLPDRYFHPQRLTREMVDSLIDNIFVGKRIPGTRNVPIEIHWNL